MQYVLVSIKDSVAGFYRDPACVTNTDVAQRSFADTVQNPESPMAKHPGDYDLYKVGTFDDADGQIKPCDPVHICNGQQVVENNVRELQPTGN